jgi:hypothetical protein
MLRLVLIIFLFTSWVRPGFPTQFYPQDFSKTLENAPTIARGKMGASHSEWTKMADGGQQLFTYSEFEVKEVLKGKVQSQKILIRELGGEKNGVSMDIAGTVRFRSGEEVVLMLGEHTQDQGAETFPILNMSFGKLNLQKDSEGREFLKGPALNGAIPPGGGKLWTLDEVKNLIENPRPVALEPKMVYSPKVKDSQNSGLLSDSARPPVSQDPKMDNSADQKKSENDPVTLQKKDRRIPDQTLILLGIAFGIILFLRSYLKKRS